MPKARHQLLEVELVEDDADGPGAGVGTGADAEGGSRPSRALVVLARVPRRLWAAAVAVVLVAIAGTAVAGALQDAAERRRLAQVAGLSTPLDQPLREAWRADGSGVFAATDDLLLLWEPAGEGLMAVDHTTGAVRYTLPGTCQVVVADTRAAALAGLVGAPVAGPDDHVLCIDRRFTGLGGDGPAGEGVGDGAGHLHTLGTGELVRTIPLGAPDEWSIVGDDVVTLGLDVDRHMVASRWSLRTGEQRWAYRSPEPAPAPRDDWTSSTSDTAVGYRIGDWSTMLDAATGVPLPPEAAPDRGALGSWGPYDAGGGTMLSGTFSIGGGAETTVDPPGAEPFSVPGHVLPLVVDDGTGDGMLLFSRATDDPTGSRLHGIDATTGDTRWTALVDAGQAVALSGLVIVRDWLMTTGLDAGTGEARWVVSSDATPDGAGPGWGLVTDGRLLLTLELQDSDWVLVARDVETGETTWTTPSPVDGGSLVQGPDGVVLLAGSSEVVALRR